MENIQIEKLKINATNISSSLFRYNKQLIKLKKDRIKLTQVEENKRKVSKKEAGIESSFKQSVANIGKQLIAKPLSLIDKFKEFFGLILLGIFVNNLPKIIETLQNIFAKIKDFLDKNPLIMQGIKLGFKIIGVGIMGLVKLIKEIRPYIGGSFKFALDTLKSTKNQIGSLITTFDELNLSFGGLIKDLDVDKIPDPSKDAAKYSSFVAGGGKAALESKGMTVDEVVEQGKKNISGYDVKPERQTQTPAPQLSAPGSMYPAAAPPQRLARGGTIGGRGLGNIPPQEGTGRGGPSDIRLSSSTPGVPSPFARPGGTAKGRKAKESINAFKLFEINVRNESRNLENQEKNYDLFGEFLSSYKVLTNLRKKYPDDESSLPRVPRGPGGTASVPDEPISVNEKEVIGKVGSTGMSTGPHIHLESMSNDKKIPLSLRENIMVGGKSLIDKNFPGMDPIGDRLHPILKVMRYHAGEDWPAPVNSKITLRGGLKFVKYIEEGTDPRYDGYGNLSIIEDTDGKQYFMAHLNSGPPNLSALLQRQQQQLSKSIPGANNEEKVWNFFMSKPGMTNIAVSGIMGNAEEESRFDPLARGIKMGPNKTDALGLFQWGEQDRWVGLTNWAQKNKLNPNNIDTQLRWTWIELGGNYFGALENIKKAKTPEEAAEIWRTQYEIASGGVQKRQTNARAWYTKWKNKKYVAPTQVLPPLTPVQKLEQSIIETMVEKLGVNKLDVNGKTIKIDTDRTGKKTLRITTPGGFLGMGAAQNVPMTEPTLNEILKDLNKLNPAQSSVEPVKQDGLNGSIDNNNIGSEIFFVNQEIAYLIPQTIPVPFPIETPVLFPVPVSAGNNPAFDSIS